MWDQETHARLTCKTVSDECRRAELREQKGSDLKDGWMGLSFFRTESRWPGEDADLTPALVSMSGLRCSTRDVQEKHLSQEYRF